MMMKEHQGPGPSELNGKGTLRHRFGAAVLALHLVGVGMGCGKIDDSAGQRVDSSFPLSVTVHKEGNQPVPGVRLYERNIVVGVTDSSGVAKVALEGVEGGSATLLVKCPESFTSPDKPIVVGLRHLAQGSPLPKFESQCVSLEHSVVVGIRAENGAHLPVRYLEKVVGETDEAGVAHVALQVTSKQPITLTLDTAQNGNLLPQNPTLTFSAPERDELVLFEQKFTVKPRVVRVTKKGPVPVRL
jgi:hypothetical protein